MHSLDKRDKSEIIIVPVPAMKQHMHVESPLLVHNFKKAGV